MNIIGDGRNAHFLLKRNTEKNDEKELLLGKQLYNSVHSYLISTGTKSILDQASNFDDSYSLSFTEAATTDHMMNEYGEELFCARLDFDLRRSNLKCEPCMYCNEDDLPELTKCFIDDFTKVAGIDSASSFDAKILKVLIHSVSSMEILSKVFTIKLEDEWSQEREWRCVRYKQNHDELVPLKDSLCLPMDIPIQYLKRIVLLYRKEKSPEFLALNKTLHDWKKVTRCSWIQICTMKFNDQ